MTTYYVDSNFTGVSDGSQLSPYKHFLDIPSWSAGDNISLAENSEYFLTDTNGIELRTNATAADPITWKCTTEAGAFADKPVIYQATRYSNNADYVWVDSGVNGEYYLEAAGGGNPNITEPKSGTVDGYYRGSSCNDNNSALEQRATDTVQGNDPVIESMADLVWGWGSGATTSLGFNTLWFKPEAGKTPNDYDIIMSSGNYVLRDNNQYHNFQDIVLSHGNVAVSTGRHSFPRTFDRCVLANADFACFQSGSDIASLETTFTNCIFSQSHRAVGIAHSVGKTTLNNCVVHNLHIVMIDEGSSGSELELNNTIIIDGESGIVDITGLTTFTENNNVFYQRHNASNDASKKLRYTTEIVDYPNSAASTLPPLLDSDQILTQAELVDPKFVATSLHDWKLCDFRLQFGSPAVNAGRPLAGITTDALGQAVHPLAPTLGLFTEVVQPTPEAGSSTTGGVTQEYLNSTNLPEGRDFGTKRYQDDGDIIGNYIHTDFPNA